MEMKPFIINDVEYTTVEEALDARVLSFLGEKTYPLSRLESLDKWSLESLIRMYGITDEEMYSVVLEVFAGIVSVPENMEVLKESEDPFIKELMEQVNGEV